MGKKECDIVRDLLVLYEDDAISVSGREMIDSHIMACEECRKICQDTKKTVPELFPKENTADEVLDNIFVKTVKGWKRKYKSLYLGIFIIMLCVVGMWNGGLKYWISSIPSEDIEVAELYELSTGDIYCTLRSDTPAFHISAKWEQDLPKHGGEPQNFAEDAVYELHYQSAFPLEKAFGNREPYSDVRSYILEMEHVYHTQIDEKPKQTIRGICREIQYKGKNEKDVLVFWEQGDKIKKAPGDIEKEALLAYGMDGLMKKALCCAERLGMSKEALLDFLSEDEDSGKAIQILCGGSTR